MSDLVYQANIATKYESPKYAVKHKIENKQTLIWIILENRLPLRREYETSLCTRWRRRYNNGSDEYFRCSYPREENLSHLFSGMDSSNTLLVIQNAQGGNVTTSLLVAEVFKKRHSDVLRDVRNLHCSDEFRRLNFALMVEMRELPQGGSQKAEWYEMTKDGFSFLVMGYTGEKAGQFKELFISEFNKREALLKSDDYILMRSQQILQKRIDEAEAKIMRLQLTNEEQRKELAEAAPKVEYHDKVLSSEGYLTVNMIAATIGITDRKLNKLRCEWGVQYKESGCYHLYAPYRGKGYAKQIPYPYRDSMNQIKTKQHLYWTEVGKKFIIEMYEKKSA